MRGCLSCNNVSSGSLGQCEDVPDFNLEQQLHGDASLTISPPFHSELLFLNNFSDLPPKDGKVQMILLQTVCKTFQTFHVSN